MPATYTKIYPKPFLVVHELMHRPLPPAAEFGRTGVVAACFQSEINIVAGIIALVTHSGILDLLVGDLEAMAGWADESTGVAAYAVA